MKDIKKLIKKNDGMMTIEASISFILFMFLILFIYCFSNIYIAQNIMSHALTQATQTIALESYGHKVFGNDETVKQLEHGNQSISKIVGLFKSDGQNFEIGWTDSFTEIKSSTQLKKAVKKAMTESMVDVTKGDYNETAKQKLENVGIKNGLDGVDFSGTKITSDEIIITVKYDVYLQYPFMGKDKITVSKSAKSKLFAKNSGNSASIN